MAVNSFSSKVRLSFSSKTPTRKRIFCFLEIVLDMAMAADRKAGIDTLTFRYSDAARVCCSFM